MVSTFCVIRHPFGPQDDMQMNIPRTIQHLVQVFNHILKEKQNKTKKSPNPINKRFIILHIAKEKQR